jgi:hypothetical protein
MDLIAGPGDDIFRSRRLSRRMASASPAGYPTMSAPSTRPAADEHAPYYEKYVRLVPEGDITATLSAQLHETLSLLGTLSDAEGDFAYAPGKWAIKEVVGHVADTERVFSYRLLRAARGDTTPLPGFDENLFTPAGRFTERSLASLLEEFSAVRAATVALLANLPDDAWARRGVANGSEFSVRAVAFILAGHELHHADLVRTRYLPALAGEGTAAV